MQDLRWTGEDDDAECSGAGNNGGKKKKMKKSKVMKSGIRAKAKARKDKFEAARQAAELEEEIEDFDDEEAMLLKHDCLCDIVVFLSFGFVGCVCVSSGGLRPDSYRVDSPHCSKSREGQKAVR